MSELEEQAISMIQTLEHIVLNDRSEIYEYGEKRTSDLKKPRQGARWLTPKEMAREMLASLPTELIEKAKDKNDPLA